MSDMPVRWLLLLGSNLDSDASMHAALARLAAQGSAMLLTPIRRFPSDDGSRREYYNALVEWQHAGDDSPMLACIRQLELELGRDRGNPDEVAIDIDVLARRVDDRWHAHPHAMEKHEFERALVIALLGEAGIDVIKTPQGKV